MHSLPSQLHLNVFITGAGHHEATWRLPGTAAERVDDVDYFPTYPGLSEALASIS